MAKDKSKSVVLSLKTHLAKATIDTWYTDFKKRQINITSQRTNMSNTIIHTQNIQTKAEWKTIHQQSISHYKTIKSCGSILINLQTGHDIYILACTYVNDFLHTRMHRWASTHIILTSVYTAHTPSCKYKHLQSYLLIKEQTEHDIGEVCMISSDWYNANTVKNNNDIIIKAHYEIS